MTHGLVLGSCLARGTSDWVKLYQVEVAVNGDGHRHGVVEDGIYSVFKVIYNLHNYRIE